MQKNAKPQGIMMKKENGYLNLRPDQDDNS